MNEKDKISNLLPADNPAAERGRLGGIAAQAGRRERAAKLKAFRAYLEALPTPMPWLIDSAAANYMVVLRSLKEGQTRNGLKRPQSRDVVWATARIEDAVRN